MVKYGYAGSVDEMIERLEYDILYYENMSLILDITILIYTVKTVFTGKGFKMANEGLFYKLLLWREKRIKEKHFILIISFIVEFAQLRPLSY